MAHDFVSCSTPVKIVYNCVDISSTDRIRRPIQMKIRRKIRVRPHIKVLIRSHKFCAETLRKNAIRKRRIDRNAICYTNCIFSPKNFRRKLTFKTIFYASSRLKISFYPCHHSLKSYSNRRIIQKCQSQEHQTRLPSKPNVPGTLPIHLNVLPRTHN